MSVNIMQIEIKDQLLFVCGFIRIYFYRIAYDKSRQAHRNSKVQILIAGKLSKFLNIMPAFMTVSVWHTVRFLLGNAYFCTQRQESWNQRKEYGTASVHISEVSKIGKNSLVQLPVHHLSYPVMLTPVIFLGEISRFV